CARHPLHLPSFPTRRSSDLCVVANVPWRLYSGSSTPRSAAVTTGKYSGLQPAMTALAASACTVGTIWRGGTAEKGRLSPRTVSRSEEHTSELQSRVDLVCRL